VRPFRGHGEGWRVSTGGGTFPIWSRTRRELFYGADGQIMVAAYTVEGDAFRAEKPRVLSNARYSAMGPARMFDLSPDGLRFAVAPAAQPEEGRKRDSVVVILNFFRRAAADFSEIVHPRPPIGTGRWTDAEHGVASRPTPEDSPK
jgi:hypothetical protein